jgi:2-keto-4-pentenoate hydratase/2-oxohepta-3-ene-1,7-dioic acid hydratase in catechol pathway
MTLWARFRAADGRVGFGMLQGSEIVEHHGDMFGAVQAAGRTLTEQEYTILSPCQPGKIVALWNNFHALAAKIGKAAPPHPLFFIKSGTSMAGMNEPIRRPSGYTGKIIFEGELGVVVGKPCRNIALADAGRHIFGYTCVNDVTALDILLENPDFPQWSRSKSFDTFGCLGPCIATDLDWAASSVVVRLDGVERQNYPLSDMIFSPAELVSRISHDLTLLPGDVIACGTSLGAGSIKAGARVEVSIAGVGALINRLSADGA